MPLALLIAGQQPIAVSAAGGRYEEVVKLQETLCVLKAQFQKLQLTDVGNDQTQQRALYNKAQKVRLSTFIGLAPKHPRGRAA